MAGGAWQVTAGGGGEGLGRRVKKKEAFIQQLQVMLFCKVWYNGLSWSSHMNKVVVTYDQYILFDTLVLSSISSDFIND